MGFVNRTLDANKSQIEVLQEQIAFVEAFTAADAAAEASKQAVQDPQYDA